MKKVTTSLRYLNDWLGIREIRQVGHDLGQIGSEVPPRRRERIEVEVADGEIGSGCVGHHAGEALIDRGLEKIRADESVNKRHVFLDVIVDVEMIAGLIGVHDAEFDHGASGGTKDVLGKIRQCGRVRVKGGKRKIENGNWKMVVGCQDAVVEILGDPHRIALGE